MIIVFLDGWKRVITKEPISKQKQQRTQRLLSGLTVKGYHVNLWLVPTVWSVSPHISHPPADLSSLHTGTVRQNKMQPADQLNGTVGDLEDCACCNGFFLKRFSTTDLKMIMAVKTSV